MPNTATPETAEDYRFKLSTEFGEPISHVVAWAAIINKIIEEDVQRLPGMTKHEANNVYYQLDLANDQLKEAVERLVSVYHGLTKEEEEEDA
jgi:hypothetical protein